MGVPVYKRILDLFEAEGVNTLFGTTASTPHAPSRRSTSLPS